ncbi:MAG: tRNA (N(6)-L-threonylcarbamoyladenosine(37)-C(2))-methylthiotransferase MtaB [Clostridiales bacterium]|nr:tRNA (N(6)-L-threonylcarbamoyladenosine(37)-C(2))-methylthiotransferase MtaB [Clostridiales bacterium]
MSYRVYFLTLGCKVNSYETAAIAKLLEKEGLLQTDDPKEADVYVVNTCAVTGEADRKSRQMIRRARRVAPTAIVVAMGCHTQMCREEDGADIVVGTDDRPALVPMLLKRLELRKELPESGELDAGSRFFEYGSIPYQENTRAVIKIEDGCNNFCTYCIIPYARGRVRSREREAILSEIRDSAKEGYREFVITGIHLCSFEKEKGRDSTALGELLDEISEIEGVERIRLGSLEPSCLTEELISMLKRNGKICPHFHLSLQSGSDSVLKRMNRKYDTVLFRKVVRDLRAAFPNASLTTDMICGFPGETEEEHRESCALAEEVRFTHIHVFPYSRRDGTKAAAMKDQIPVDVKNRRTSELRAISDGMEEERTGDFLGKDVEVLVEKMREDGTIEGYCREYVRVLANTTEKTATGDILVGKVTGNAGPVLTGECFTHLRDAES